MKRVLAVYLWCVFVLCGTVLFGQSAAVFSSVTETPVLIAIDAGHGGFDGGAVGVGGSTEKEINLEISMRLRDLCLLSGFETVMTRTFDTDTGDPNLSASKRKQSDIHQREALFESVNADIALSIHQNQYSDPSVFGAQMFYGVKHPDSAVYAAALQKRMLLLNPENKRQEKEGPQSVYLTQQTDCPYVLAECGFISNAAEEQKLCDPAEQQKIAAALLGGICDVFQIKEQHYEE